MEGGKRRENKRGKGEEGKKKGGRDGRNEVKEGSKGLLRGMTERNEGRKKNEMKGTEVRRS